MSFKDLGKNKPHVDTPAQAEARAAALAHLKEKADAKAAKAAGETPKPAAKGPPSGPAKK